MSVIVTGAGPDNTEIVSVDAIQFFSDKRPVMIRVISSGGLREEAAVGNLVISTSSVRLKNTST